MQGRGVPPALQTTMHQTPLLHLTGIKKQTSRQQQKKNGNRVHDIMYALCCWLIPRDISQLTTLAANSTARINPTSIKQHSAQPPQ